jgi:PEP-CTERM motif
MFLRLNWLGIGLCAAVSLIGATSYANQVTINFGDCTQISASTPALCPNQDAGTSQITYTNGGLSVTATGFLNPVSSSTANNGREDLYVKQGGAGETGLGTVVDLADHEITDMDFVNLDFSNLWAHGISSAQITIESLQTGEDFKICQGNTLGSLGVVASCVTGAQIGTTVDNTVTLTWGASNNMFGIQGYTTSGVSGPDVLVQGITFTSPTPEPASVLLFGTGLASFIVKGRRRKAKK